MTAQTNLAANLVVKGSFIVGANPNKFEISVTNKGEALQLTPATCFYLMGTLGRGQEALFLEEKDARECNKSGPKGWTLLWDFSGKAEGIFRLKIIPSIIKFNKEQTLTISFSNVISRTAPDGNAALSFETGFSDSKQELAIPKIADKPDIISFYASPPEGVQNLPGDKVILNWRTFKLTDRALIQVGRSDPLPCIFDQDEGSKTIRVSDTDINFRLQGYSGNRPIFRELQIKALRSGWHDIKNTVWEGDPGYPEPEPEIETETPKKTEGLDLEPTLLLNANDVCLYGIFRREFAGKKKAFLFQTANPFVGWDFVESTVPNQSGSIPEGFATSPGAYFGKKLWLIGGSQIDQQKTSRGVWCLDPTQEPQKIWQQCREAEWPARMGHAVLEFQNKIWVMGGRDEAGNALNDVWILDAGKVEWTRVTEKSWHSGRCLINPVVFEDKIWLYGGAREPSSAELYDDLYICSPVNAGDYKWEKQESLTGAITGTGERPKKPIASCLQVLRGKLHLFGKFRTTAQDKSRFDEPLGFCLSDPSTGTWERFPSDGLGTWGTYTTYSYQAVNFNGMLIAKAFPASNRDPNPILKVYLPG